MNQFQTQSQWENEADSIEKNFVQQEKMQKSVQLRISKKTLIFVGVCVPLAIAIMLSVYIFGRPIEGVWVRQQDDSQLAGMTVEVINTGNISEGHIIALADNAPMFEVGQVKWFNIKKIGFGQYECDSLIHNNDSGDCYYSGNKSIITVLAGGDQLTLVSDSTDLITGAYQVWVKQK